MNYIQHRTNYFHLDGPKIHCAKRIESQQLQTAVEAFQAKGGKIERIPMGMSSYLTDLQKGRLKKKFKTFYDVLKSFQYIKAM